MTTRDDRYDLIRGLAIILIVFIHSMGRLASAAEGDAFYLRLDSAGIQSVISTGVHLFILLSGALLLGKEEPAGAFYRKRIRRIIPPFLIWSLVVYTLTCLVSGPILWKTAIPDFFQQFLTHGVHATYWFVYMIFGLYLVTPLLRIVCREEKNCLLLLGITASVYLLNLTWPDFSATGRWFSQNISCLMDYVAGFAIVRFLRGKTWLRPAAWVLFVASTAVDIFCRFFVGEVLPFEITSAWGLFTLLVTIPGPIRLPRPFRLLSETSFGIYLSHCLFISAFVRLTATAGIPLWADPFLTAIAVLAAEFGMMWVLWKLRLTRFLA